MFQSARETRFPWEQVFASGLPVLFGSVTSNGGSGQSPRSVQMGHHTSQSPEVGCMGFGLELAQKTASACHLV